MYSATCTQCCMVPHLVYPVKLQLAMSYAVATLLLTISANATTILSVSGMAEGYGFGQAASLLKNSGWSAEDYSTDRTCSSYVV